MRLPTKRETRSGTGTRCAHVVSASSARRGGWQCWVQREDVSCDEDAGRRTELARPAQTSAALACIIR